MAQSKRLEAQDGRHGGTAMTVRKTDNLLRGDRTPAYVDRETGAAELLISPDTWDQWVKEGRLPRPCDTFPTGMPRWRWEDVDRRLSGTKAATPVDAMSWAASFGKKTRRPIRGHSGPRSSAARHRLRRRIRPVRSAI